MPSSLIKRAERQQRDAVLMLEQRQERLLQARLKEALSKDAAYQKLLTAFKSLRAESHNNKLNITKKSSALQAKEQVIAELRKTLSEHVNRQPQLNEALKQNQLQRQEAIDRITQEV